MQLDGTLITVALPSVGRGLGVSAATTSIVLGSYFAAYALVLLPGGALVDRFGARRVALLGLSIFGLGAALGALSSSLGALVAARIVQGAGAGLVSPAALAGAVSGFPPERRGSALGIWGASAGVSNLLGPLLGWAVDRRAGSRADWWALVPLAILAAWAIVAHLPRIVHSEEGGTRTPVLNNTDVRASALVAALTFAVMIGSFYLAEQYLQRTAGYSALGASAVLVLAALLAGAAAPVAGRLVDRHGEQLLAMAGFLAAGSGLLVLGIPEVSLRSAGTIVALIPVGLGLGMLFVPVSRARSTPPHGPPTDVPPPCCRSGGCWAAGAGLGGLALSGGPTATTVHEALLLASALCLIVGIPASTRLSAPARAPGHPLPD